jgi:uncharacterized repeat protein (TIGR01451 family)
VTRFCLLVGIAQLLLFSTAAQAQIVLTTTAQKAEVVLGSEVAYDVAFTSSGVPQAFTLRDPRPDANHTLLSVSIQSQSIDCTTTTGGSLGAGITVTCDAGGGELRVAVPQLVQSGALTVHYRVSAAEISRNQVFALCGSALTPCGESQIAETQVVAPALTLAKSGPSTAQPGGDLAYAITVGNDSLAALPGVTIDDPLPNGIRLSTIEIGGSIFSAADLQSRHVALDGAAASLTGSTLHVELPPLAKAAKYSFTLHAKIDATLQPGATLTNLAIAHVPAIADVSSGAVTTSVAAGPSPLLLSNRVSPAAAKVGDLIHYKVTLTPASPQPGPILLDDPLDPALAPGAVRLDGRPMGCQTSPSQVGAYVVDCGSDGRHLQLRLPTGATLSQAVTIERDATVLPIAAAQIPNSVTVTDARGATLSEVAPLSILDGGANGATLVLTAGKTLAAKNDLVPFVATVAVPAGAAMLTGTLEIHPSVGLRVGDVIESRPDGTSARIRPTERNGHLEIALPALGSGAMANLRLQARVGGRASRGKETVEVRLVAGSLLAIRRAEVQIIDEPDLDLGTLLGEVYRDDNGDGKRDRGEPGLEGVQVVMDDGLSAITDADGRYHLAAITPGQRAIKIAAHTLPPGARLSTDDTRIVAVSAGSLWKIDFGVRVLRPEPPERPQAVLTRAPEVTPLADGTLRYRYFGNTTRGTRLTIAGQLVAVDRKSGAFAVTLILQRGRNRLPIVTEYSDGRVVISSRDIFWLESHGSPLLVPRPELPRVTLRMPAKPLAESTFLLEGAVEQESPAVVSLTVAGQPIGFDKEGSFGLRLKLPSAGAGLQIAARFTDGLEVRFDHLLEVKSDFVLLVGLAEGKFGYVKRENGAGGGLYAEGRVKLYVKGRIQGRWLLEGGLDLDSTQIDSWRDLFRSDPQKIFRNLDPDRFYTVYGDASETHESAPTRGRLFVRIQVDKSELLLGNLQTGLSGVEFGRYSRAVTGGRLSFVRASARPDGQPSTQVILFGAWLQTARTHDELRGTGGSLYYLSHRDLVEGSEQVRLEYRDRISGRPTSNRAQRSTVDYEIDYLTGRVTLRDPLSSVGGGTELVRSTALDADQAFLVVDYEYVVLAANDDGTIGARATQWLGPVRIGGTVVNEFRSIGSYTLVGGDLQVDLKNWGTLRGEYAHSFGTLTSFAHSDDGGLSYRDALAGQAAPSAREGNAWKAEADLHHFGIELHPYARGIDQGYVDTATGQDAGSLQWGVEASVGLLNAQLRFHYDERRDSQIVYDATGTAIAAPSGGPLRVGELRRDIGGEIGRRFGRVTVQVGARSERLDDTDPLRAGHRTAVGGRIDIAIVPRLTLYASGQYAVERGGGTGLLARDNSLGSVGAIAKISRIDANLTGEVSYGASGVGGLLRLRTNIGPGRVLYGTFSLSEDRDDRLITEVATGGRERVNDQSGQTHLTLFAEDQFRDGPLILGGAIAGTERAHVQAAGFELPIGRRFVLGASYERGMVAPSSGGGLLNREIGIPARGSAAVVDSTSGTLSRDAGSAFASYAGDKFRVQLKGELRSDRFANGPDEKQWLFSAAATWQIHRDLTIRGKAFFSHSKTAKQDAALSSEATGGFAWRPSFTDRIVLLGRYTYLEEGTPSAQAQSGAHDPATGLPLLLRERSHVTSLAGEGRLIWRISLGEKVAAKYREEPEEGTAAWIILWVNRVSLHVTRAWDAVVEYRLLSVPSTSIAHGVSLEINRTLVGHLRLGVGWNFADFSDEELQLGRGSEKGFFIRAQGFY